MRRLAWIFVTAAACGSSDDGGSPRDCGCVPDTPQVDAPVNPGRATIGTLRIVEHRLIYDDAGTPSEQRYSTVAGWYVVGRMSRWQREIARVGDCTLYRFMPAFCDPPCEGGLCIDTNTCEPFVDFQPAGNAVVNGLNVPLTLVGDQGYYYNVEPVPADLFPDAGPITVQYAGADVPAHTIEAAGVPPIATPIQTYVTLTPHQDATFTWTPAAGDARVHLTLNSNNQSHGAPLFGIIECDAADAAGQIVVDRSLIDGFPEVDGEDQICAGHDCPPSELRRYRRGVTSLGDADAELIVASQFDFYVDHPIR